MSSSTPQHAKAADTATADAAAQGTDDEMNEMRLVIMDSGELATRRWAEADAGTLSMPETPATLYVLMGDGFDAASEAVENSFLRWVVYTPWATPESTGLSPAPSGPGAPWLMFPGTAGAHIMITPPPSGGEN